MGPLYPLQPAPDHGAFQAADRGEACPRRHLAVARLGELQPLALDLAHDLRLEPGHPDRDRTACERVAHGGVAATRAKASSRDMLLSTRPSLNSNSVAFGWKPPRRRL